MNFIAIDINGSILDLPLRLQLQFELISPLFDREIKDGSHSFSFVLPNTPNNRLALGFADSAVIYDSPVQYDAIVHAYGLPWLEGIAHVESGGPGGFNMRIEADMSPLAASLQDTMLKDIDLGGVRNIATGNTSSQQLSIQQLVPGGIAGLEVNGRSYFIPWQNGVADATFLTLFSQAINAESNLTNVSATVQNVNGVNLLSIVALPGFNTVMVVINPPGNEQLWTFQNEIGLADIIHAAILDHMKQISLLGPGGADYCFAPIYAPLFYDELNADFQEYVNFWDWDLQVYRENTTLATQRWRNTAVPFPRLVYVIEQLFSHMGYSVSGDILQDPDFNAIYLWNNVGLDYTRELNGVDFNGLRSTFDMRDHVPQDWTAANFVVFLRDKFNLGFVPDLSSKSIHIITKTSLPGNNAADWTHTSLKGALVSRKPEKDRGYELIHAVDETDQYGKDGTQESLLASYEYGPAVSPIETPAAPLIDKVLPYPGSADSWRTSACKQVGKTIWPGLEGSEGEMRLIMYRGMVAGPGGKQYPLATYGNTDYLGNLVGQYGLSWSSPAGSFSTKGLFEQFWFNWLNGREEEAEVSQPLKIPIHQLFAINYLEVQQHSHPDGMYNALIKRISITLTETGPQATAKLHRL